MSHCRGFPVPPLFAAAAAFALLAGASAPVAAQVTAVSLTDAGREVQVPLTAEQVTMGRAVAHGMLAGARRDVTRPVSDEEVEALGDRGTLLRVHLARAESVYLLRLGASARASRIAAYVPPDADDHAFVFLGRSSWQRIVVVSLPEALRRELRALRGASGD
jgi:hypothetical protein